MLVVGSILHDALCAAMILFRDMRIPTTGCAETERADLLVTARDGTYVVLGAVLDTVPTDRTLHPSSDFAHTN